MGSLTMRAYLPSIRLRGLTRAPALVTGSRRRPELAKGERALMSERDATTRRRVVATGSAIHYQDLDRGFAAWHRLGWDEVERADWDADRAELRIVSLAPETAPHLVLRSPGARRLLDLARERIRATTLVHVPLRPAGWLAARRPASGDGEVRWVVRPAPGAEPTDAEVAEIIRTVRVQAGL